MKVYLAADHAGFALKEKIKAFLSASYDVEDCGAPTLQNDDDYVDFVTIAAKKISENPEDRAIIIGGSGQGEVMVANKYAHVRAALFYGTRVPYAPVDVTDKISTNPYEIIRLAREHNNANILSLAARFLTEEEAKQAVQLFLAVPFPQEQRHNNRIDKFENLGEK